MAKEIEFVGSGFVSKSIATSVAIGELYARFCDVMEGHLERVFDWQDQKDEFGELYNQAPWVVFHETDYTQSGLSEIPVPSFEAGVEILFKLHGDLSLLTWQRNNGWKVDAVFTFRED